MQKCNVCQGDKVIKIFDLGEQPVCHRFLSRGDEKEYTFFMELGQCLDCGTVQLLNYMPVDEMRPRFDWLVCTEPEAHLDDLVEKLSRLPDLNKTSKIWGVSFKEDTTLARFNKLGFQETYRLDIREDLGAEDPLADVETVVNNLTVQCAKTIVAKRGKADMIIARHLIEHAFDLRMFIEAIKTLVKPEGYVVFEIPDCKRAFEQCDYTNYWEEHTVYFTPETFHNVFGFFGLKLCHFERAEYPLEDSYIGISKPCTDFGNPFPESDKLKEEVDRAHYYASQYETKKADLMNFFKNFRENKGKIAIFGAAHMCCTYLNVLDIKDYIEFVVDDNPHKKGMFMPGSRLPICGSKFIVEQNVKLCLLTLSPESEEKVLANNKAFLDQGGIFKSIFPSNSQALRV